ncbi:MAG: transcriptional repressor LexA [Dokdonella sp.]
MDTALTPNQLRVLDYIRQHLAAHDSAPSLREIADALGFARHSSAQAYVDALVRKGVLERLPQHRGLRLGSQLRPPPSLTLPLIGRVAAGSPILALENVENEYSVDAQLFRPRADYLLRVNGMSMRDAGILDGDLIAVHRCAEAASGRIVIARIEDEVTVKQLELRNGRIRLLPANPDFAPIEVDPEQQSFAIEGIHVGVIRRA